MSFYKWGYSSNSGHKNWHIQLWRICTRRSQRRHSCGGVPRFQELLDVEAVHCGWLMLSHHLILVLNNIKHPPWFLGFIPYIHHGDSGWVFNFRRELYIYIYVMWFHPMLWQQFWMTPVDLYVLWLSLATCPTGNPATSVPIENMSSTWGKLRDLTGCTSPES